MAPPSRIAQLATIISENTAILDKHHTDNNIPPLSFKPSNPTDHTYPSEISTARAAIEEATLELHDLTRGPRSILTEGPNQWASRAFIAKFDLAPLVPAEGSISYADLASQTNTGIAPTALQTLCRLAIAHRIFVEPEANHIAHSAASKILHDDPIMRQFFSANADFFPLTANVTPALQQFPSAVDPTETGAALAAGTVGSKDFYDLLADDPTRAADFHAAMKLFAMDPGLSMRHACSAFDWAGLPEGSLCVDLGGGAGEAAVAVARAFPHLSWEVQDLRAAFVDLPSLQPDVADRVTFREQNFFTPQPSPTASNDSMPAPSVFFFRWIFHNHPDAACQRILRALIPSLQRNPKAKIVIMDNILPPMNALPNTAERVIRSMDVTMLELGNGRERGEEDWRALVTGADPDGRFVVERCGMLAGGSRLGVVVVRWKGL